MVNNTMPWVDTLDHIDSKETSDKFLKRYNSLLGRIVIINGCGGCGKDTFVSYASSYAIKHNTAVRNISSIDPMRYVVEYMTEQANFNITSKDSTRNALAKLKQIWDEEFNGSFYYLVEELRKIDTHYRCNSKHVVVFVHIREPKNIEALVNGYRKYLPNNWDIQTLAIAGRTKPEDYDNPADREVYNYSYDTTIYNTGTLQELGVKAYEYMSGIISQFD